MLPPGREAVLFEYDRRFGKTADKVRGCADAVGVVLSSLIRASPPTRPQYAFYDCNKPLELPMEYMGAFAGIVLDPPYLNPDCLRSFASTVYAIAASADVPVMLCTGAVMCLHARKLLGVRPTNLAIEHEGSRLSNPFACYVSYDDASHAGGWNTELEAAYSDADEAGK